METILITGGAGFVGRYLTRDILRLKSRVIVLDNFTAESSRFANFHNYWNPPVFSNNPQCVILNGDIRDSNLLKTILKKYQPDYVVHLAAISDANLARMFPDECKSVNVQGLNNIFIMMNSVVKVKRFIFVSSSYVYGNFKYEPVDELHFLEPEHIYGITKLEGERITIKFCTENDIEYTIIRPTAVYGAGSSLQRVCCKMIIDALTKKEITIYNGGIQKLDFTHIDDLINGFLKIIYNDNAKNQIFNLSRGKARSLSELAELIRIHVPGTMIINQNGESEKPLRGALNISKAGNMLGFKPHIDIEEGIPILINDLLRSKGKYDKSVSAVH